MRFGRLWFRLLSPLENGLRRKWIRFPAYRTFLWLINNYRNNDDWQEVKKKKKAKKEAPSKPVKEEKKRKAEAAASPPTKKVKTTPATPAASPTKGRKKKEEEPAVNSFSWARAWPAYVWAGGCVHACICACVRFCACSISCVRACASLRTMCLRALFSCARVRVTAFACVAFLNDRTWSRRGLLGVALPRGARVEFRLGLTEGRTHSECSGSRACRSSLALVVATYGFLRSVGSRGQRRILLQ